MAVTERPVSGPEPTSHEGNSRLWIPALYGLIAGLILWRQVGGFGALGDEWTLLTELQGTGPEAPWEMGRQIPFAYRPLFRSLVMTVYGLFEPSAQTFFRIFIAASFASLWFAALSFHALLGAMGFGTRRRLASVLLFLAGFPIVFSHDMPIHTREDFLGYGWICLTLLACARDRPLMVSLLGCVGATIRETCLLGVLPFFLVSSRPWRHRLAVYLLPGLVLVGLRLTIHPDATGQVSDVATWVQTSFANTWAHPGEALLYLFASFGAIWVLAAIRLLDPAAPCHLLLSRRVVGLALASVVLTGWTIGNVVENRITYILFPFLIPLAVDAIARAGPALWRPVLGWLVAIAIGLAALTGYLVLKENPESACPQLARVIGNTFNPGVVPVKVGLHQGERVAIWQTHASFWNGPHVAFHLMVIGGVLVNLASARRQSLKASEGG